MAFKQKSGSPMKRNFGVGNNVKSPLEIEEVEKKDEKVEWKETSRRKVSPNSQAGKKGSTWEITLVSPTGGTKTVYS